MPRPWPSAPPAVTLTAELRGLPPDAVTAGQMTYELRQLRTHGLISKIPHSHRYRITDHGLHTAMFLTRIHDRLLPTGLAHQNDSTDTGPLRAAATRYQQAIDTLRHRSMRLTPHPKT